MINLGLVIGFVIAYFGGLVPVLLFGILWAVIVIGIDLKGGER
jgi:hypothetical protein